MSQPTALAKIRCIAEQAAREGFDAYVAMRVAAVARQYGATSARVMRLVERCACRVVVS